MNNWMRKRQRQIAWFCAAVALWMPWDAQLHGLWHARQAVHEASARADLPPQAAHGAGLPHAAQVCEQCLLFSALDAALPSHALDFPTVGEAPATRPAVVRSGHADPFTAYRTRAPPLRA